LEIIMAGFYWKLKFLIKIYILFSLSEIKIVEPLSNLCC